MKIRDQLTVQKVLTLKLLAQDIEHNGAANAFQLASLRDMGILLAQSPTSPSLYVACTPDEFTAFATSGVVPAIDFSGIDDHFLTGADPATTPVLVNV